MKKYKNKDGIELNYTSNDTHTKLVKEVIGEAIRILNSHNHFDSESKSWAISRCVGFLETNFDISTETEERSDEWRIEQFNRNRATEDQVSTIGEMENKVNEIFNS